MKREDLGDDQLFDGWVGDGRAHWGVESADCVAQVYGGPPEPAVLEKLRADVDRERRRDLVAWQCQGGGDYHRGRADALGFVLAAIDDAASG